MRELQGRIFYEGLERNWLIETSLLQILESRGPDLPVPPLAAECSLGQLVILEPVALRQSQRNAAAGSLPAIHQNPGKMIMIRMLHVGKMAM